MTPCSAARVQKLILVRLAKTYPAAFGTKLRRLQDPATDPYPCQLNRINTVTSCVFNNRYFCSLFHLHVGVTSSVLFRHGSSFLMLCVGCNSYYLKYSYSYYVLGLVVENCSRLNVSCRHANSINSSYIHEKTGLISGIWGFGISECALFECQ